jgi:hypothetical protein
MTPIQKPATDDIALFSLLTHSKSFFQMESLECQLNWQFTYRRAKKITYRNRD